VQSRRRPRTTTTKRTTHAHTPRNQQQTNPQQQH
jgi:hypothetical protein